jgi:hypothetical protein
MFVVARRLFATKQPRFEKPRNPKPWESGSKKEGDEGSGRE